jgi:hypothetical protein
VLGSTTPKESTSSDEKMFDCFPTQARPSHGVTLLSRLPSCHASLDHRAHTQDVRAGLSSLTSLKSLNGAL